jgi:hypothetical protein
MPLRMEAQSSTELSSLRTGIGQLGINLKRLATYPKACSD